MDDEVPYNVSFTQLSKFTFKTECSGLGCLMNELYDPEPQTMLLGAGLVLLFVLAVYRRGRYDSSAAEVVEIPLEEQEKADDETDELEMEIPAPVTEDDDLELLDELDNI